MLDEFLDDIEILKGDIYYICNDSDGYRGLSRLNALDNRRKLFYLNLTFKTSLAKSIGEAENSKILSTGPLGNDDIIHSVFTDTILEAMYYDLFTVLENNMPIKICKTATHRLSLKADPTLFIVTELCRALRINAQISALSLRIRTTYLTSRLSSMPPADGTIPGSAAILF